MDNERWQRVESLFHEALERPADARDAFLRDACAGDDALQREVRQLLAADDAPHSLLDGRAIDALDVPRDALAEGARVGPYRVLRPIGTGGMGVVYLAERADGQFEQRVALKLIKRGMDSETILARFHAERRILARLQHPNIAGLLDGGIADDGRPYFTMEYVDGRPITAYCDHHGLGVDARLDLFRSVCAAVQYAHGNLVVHRDLKPGNILVTEDGQVKLLDFGIARVLGEDDGGITRSGQRVMTPAYASPEQVRGEPVTTASDVYALGVVLFELLSGQHPYRQPDSTPAEIERAIMTTPAEKPSRVAPQLRRRLEGDLDTICLTALRKEPQRRYASAAQLAEDIRLHLAGRPVTARPDTARYRFTKFVRRNRVAVAATAALVAAIVAMTLYYTARLARERDLARLEARKAAEVSAFLAGLFAAADPYESRGEALTARQMLDAGRERVRKELAGQPGVLAELLYTIGTAYLNLGLYDEALSAYEECLALRREFYGDRHEDVVMTMVQVVTARQARGEYEAAEELARRAVDFARTLDAGSRRPLAAAAGALAGAINMRGSFDEAEPFYRESIEGWRAVEGADGREMSVIMNNFALMLHEASRYAEADSYFTQALAIQRAVYGENHPETITTKYNYAQLMSDRGQLEAARAMWDEVVAAERVLYPDGNPAVAYTLSAYGRMLLRLGDFARAEELQRRALDIRRRYHGDTHPDVAYSLGALGRVLHERGHYDDAETYYRDALAMHRETNGPRHPIIGNVTNDIGQLRYDRGDYAGAEQLHREAFEFLVSVSDGAEVNAMATAMVRRAAALAALGRLADADSLAVDAVALLRRLHGEHTTWVAGGLSQLAEIRLERGAVAEAETLFAAAGERMRLSDEDTVRRPRDTRALLGIGRCRLAGGDVAGAEARFREAVEIERRYRRAAHPLVARAELALASALAARGDARGARVLLDSAVASLSPVVGAGQADLAEAQRLRRGLR